MAILKIARMGHPVLRAKAEPVADALAPSIQGLLADMLETLDDSGGVGLAAPQVFVSLRLFIYYVPNERAENGAGVPLRAVLNPEITPIGTEQTLDWEGCLSIPGLRAAVPRYARILLRGQDEDGNDFSEELSGFEARIVQHEADHLDGTLYPTRVINFRHFGFNEELDRFPQTLPEIL
jgi:peptide deformylase